MRIYMYNCTCKSLWIEKASPGKLGVKLTTKTSLLTYVSAYSSIRVETLFHSCSHSLALNLCPMKVTICQISMNQMREEKIGLLLIEKVVEFLI